jgi:hypothetical protein
MSVVGRYACQFNTIDKIKVEKGVSVFARALTRESSPAA